VKESPGTHTDSNVEQEQVLDQQILTEMQADTGNVKTPVKIMAKRLGTLSRFMAYHKKIFGEGPLTPRERRLVAVGVAVAMRSPACIETHAGVARKAGASEDDIVQAMLIASLMLGTSPLRSAYSGIHEGSQDQLTQGNTEQQAKEQQILANVAAKMGEVPTPLKIMSLRPGVLSSFMNYRNQVFENGPLTDRQRSLVAVGVAVAMRSPKCSHTHSNAARQAGASEDDIVQAMMIASVMLGASPLRSAYSAFSNEE
jgi:AhpD family alkylhydroperoxidase